MKENKGFDFSQLILLVPVIMLVLLVLPGKNGSVKPAAVGNNVGISAAVSSSPAQVAFNLDGPLICRGEVDGATASALIRNKNVIATVSAKTTEHYYLLKGDCVYSWEKQAKTGSQTCGIGNWLSLAGTFLSGGFGSIESALSGMGVSNAAARANEVKSALQSCRRAAIDPAVFSLPVGIQFKMQTSSQLLPIGE